MRFVGRIALRIIIGVLLIVALWTFLALLPLALTPVPAIMSGCADGLIDSLLIKALILVPLALLALFIFRRRRS